MNRQGEDDSVPFHQTDSFRRLQKTWYEKIETDGFKEIEDTSSKREYLQTWESSWFRNHYPADVFLHRRDYYFHCSSFYWNYVERFEPPLIHQIWNYYSEGLSRRKIAQKMWQEKKMKITDSRVYLIIARLQQLMKSFVLSTQQSLLEDEELGELLEHERERNSQKRRPYCLPFLRPEKR